MPTGALSQYTQTPQYQHASLVSQLAYEAARDNPGSIVARGLARQAARLYAELPARS